MLKRFSGPKAAVLRLETVVSPEAVFLKLLFHDPRLYVWSVSLHPPQAEIRRLRREITLTLGSLSVAREKAKAETERNTAKPNRLSGQVQPVRAISAGCSSRGRDTGIRQTKRRLAASLVPHDKALTLPPDSMVALLLAA